VAGDQRNAAAYFALRVTLTPLSAFHVWQIGRAPVITMTGIQLDCDAGLSCVLVAPGQCCAGPDYVSTKSIDAARCSILNRANFYTNPGDDVPLDARSTPPSDLSFITDCLLSSLWRSACRGLDDFAEARIPHWNRPIVCSSISVPFYHRLQMRTSQSSWGSMIRL